MKGDLESAVTLEKEVQELSAKVVQVKAQAIAAETARLKKRMASDPLLLPINSSSIAGGGGGTKDAAATTKTLKDLCSSSALTQLSKSAQGATSTAKDLYKKKTLSKQNEKVVRLSQQLREESTKKIE